MHGEKQRIFRSLKILHRRPSCKSIRDSKPWKIRCCFQSGFIRLWIDSVSHGFGKIDYRSESLEETHISEIETEAYSRYMASEHVRTTVEAQRDIVKRLLTQLKESDREVITLHYFEEMTSSEIGTQFLGVSRKYG